MKKISDFPENSQKIPDNLYNFSELDAGNYVPAHNFLFDLLKNKTINQNDFTLFLVILHASYFDKGRKYVFKMSYPEIKARSGMSQKPIARSLGALIELGLIHVTPKGNGCATEIVLNLENLKNMNSENHSQNDYGQAKTEVKTTTVYEKPKSKRLRSKSQTVVKLTNPLIYKVLEISLSHHNKFFEQSKRDAFKSDLELLAKQGYDLDAVASFLETCSFESIKSFYAVINRRKDDLADIHDQMQKIKAEKEAAERRRFLDRRSPDLVDITFSTSQWTDEGSDTKNAFKGITGAENIFRKLETSYFGINTRGEDEY